MKRYYQYSDSTNKDGNFYDIEEELFYFKSKYQKIEVFKTFNHGLMLVLDDIIQFTQKDEVYYHEMMSHPAICIHKSPKNILIVGGGDCGVLSNIVKYNFIDSITLCEIDEQVINVSKKFFPFFSDSLSDKRVSLKINDGFAYLSSQKNMYDIIIVDSTDPETIASSLFKGNFYEEAFYALKDDGILVAQAETPLLDEYKQLRKMIFSNLKSKFKYVNFIFFPMPCYPTGYFSAVLASKRYSPLDLSKDEIKNKISQLSLKYYDEQIHFSALTISPMFENLLK
jgi:spermidine synthase